MGDNKERQGPGFWEKGFTLLGQAVISTTLAAVISVEAAAAAIPITAVVAACGLFTFGKALTSWAFSDGAVEPLSRDEIRRERQAEGFDPKAIHVGICGPSGSGKSSIVNALRGLPDGVLGAARTGTTETTEERASYAAHHSLGALFVHDIPGAGTLRFEAKDYYQNQKLYLYDSLLVVQGERFGEIEVNIIRECVRRGQGFVIVRSRSDELLRRIARKVGGDIPRAHNEHRVSTVAAIREEMERSKASNAVVEELAEWVVLVNDEDLQRLTALDSDEWPAPSSSEMQERDLLKFLGKAGVDA